MTTFHTQPEFTLHRGDCIEKLKEIPDNSVDTFCVDGPYGIQFMGKAWDGQNISVIHEQNRLTCEKNGRGAMEAGRYNLTPKAMIAFQEFTHAWACEAFRVLKPGGHLVSFCSTRTYHRMAAGIEDAGFEIRDQLAWVYGSGFPKSHDVSKALDRAAGEEPKVIGSKKAGMGTGKTFGMLQAEGNNGDASDVVAVTEAVTEAGRKWAGWGTALKPSWEPIVLARKPLEGTVAENVLKYGTGALNIDGCRVAGAKGTGNWKGMGGDAGKLYEGGFSKPEPSDQDAAGRWPANIVHDGSPEVVEHFPNAPGAQGEVTGEEPSAAATGSRCFGKMGRTANSQPREDEGSAARFFKRAEHEEIDSLFCRAKAFIQTWTPSPVHTAENPSNQPELDVDSVLNHAVIAASRGDKVLSGWRGPSTIVTQKQLKQIAETITAAILLLERKPWPVQWRDAPTLSGSLVRSAETDAQTGTTTIMISLLRSDGCADVATFSITLRSWGHGEKGCARFNYCAKASTDDRDDGLDAFKARHGSEVTGRAVGSAGAVASAYAGTTERSRRNIHPTVKPTELMRWLLRLVTPPQGRVVDCFTGSGSTGKACMLEGFHFTGIDLDEEGEYLPIAKARILYALEHRERWDQIHAAPAPVPDTPGQALLFA